MANISINASKEKIEKMKSFYEDFKQEVNNPYIVFSAKIDGCVVNIYTTNKVTFQGEDALDESLIWQDFEDEEEVKEVIVKSNEWQVTSTHIGSDEVGTGDFFGPIVVCACLVKEEDIPYITKLGVTDSKKLNDEKIVEGNYNLDEYFEQRADGANIEPDVEQSERVTESLVSKINKKETKKLESKKYEETKFKESQNYIEMDKGL